MDNRDSPPANFLGVADGTGALRSAGTEGTDCFNRSISFINIMELQQ